MNLISRPLGNLNGPIFLKSLSVGMHFSIRITYSTQVWFDCQHTSEIFPCWVAIPSPTVANCECDPRLPVALPLPHDCGERGFIVLVGHPGRYCLAGKLGQRANCPIPSSSRFRYFCPGRKFHCYHPCVRLTFRHESTNVGYLLSPFLRVSFSPCVPVA